MIRKEHYVLLTASCFCVLCNLMCNLCAILYHLHSLVYNPNSPNFSLLSAVDDLQYKSRIHNLSSTIYYLQSAITSAKTAWVLRFSKFVHWYGVCLSSVIIIDTTDTKDSQI